MSSIIFSSVCLWACISVNAACIGSTRSECLNNKVIESIISLNNGSCRLQWCQWCSDTSQCQYIFSDVKCLYWRVNPETAWAQESIRVNADCSGRSTCGECLKNVIEYIIIRIVYIV